MADLVSFLANQTLDKSGEYDTTFKEIKKICIAFVIIFYWTMFLSLKDWTIPFEISATFTYRKCSTV